MVDESLLDAAVAALQEVGWHDLTLERVAAAAGVSRVTLWRQGVTLEQIVEGLLVRLTEDYRAMLWPTLTAEGTGCERLKAALRALCDVAERHLPLLRATDTAFHEAHNLTGTHFTEPLARLLHDGIHDGSLRAVKHQEMASVLFNTVCWTYVHLRTRHHHEPEASSAQHLSPEEHEHLHAQHHWPPERVQALLLDLVLEGLTP
jgi:AcrR family transcriptional regulator